MQCSDDVVYEDPLTYDLKLSQLNSVWQLHPLSNSCASHFEKESPLIKVLSEKLKKKKTESFHCEITKKISGPAVGDKPYLGSRATGKGEKEI